MFDTLTLLAHGLAVAATPINLLFALVGCLLGTLIGVLPGIGPLATISMLLSITIRLEPVTSLIMLAGVYYGAQYGGSTTAILCKIPGEASSVVTAIDGYMMAKKGRGGTALAAAAFSSLLAGIIATFFIAFFSPMLAQFAINFNAPEYFSLMLFGLLSSVFFSAGSKLKALAMAILGLLFGLVGTDVETGALRFTMGIGEFTDGLDLVAISMAFFGLNEIITNISEKQKAKTTTYPIGSTKMTGSDVRRGVPAALRGTLIGSILGVLPGGGVQLSPFASYMVEQKVSKHKAELGEGAVEGVAGPEAANNAAAQTSFIPLLTLGVPGNPVIALILGAMIMQGIQPGPQVLTKQPELVWGLIASMLVGNVMLVVINLPLIGLWVRLLSVRQAILFPIIIVFSCIAVYTVSSSLVNLVMMSILAVLGIVLTTLRFPLIPLLLGLVLGPMMEESLRRAFSISRGDPTVFVSRPISLAILMLTAATLAIVFLPAIRRNEAIFVAD
ncbi:tripartite tricarboxylate transporter permease [Cupriavidus sp. amp6]|uniref:tripartite tricarboxylate transporter permease n=1 Tax=Cupriavidus sp. amp6 TaxID=388051 RepID=UPI000490AEC8|nr:tripartite tricarboxylate transporter permease [Cupriavidus sp. amp6]